MRYFKARVEFDKFLAPQFLMPESLTTIATRAELQCILPNIFESPKVRPFILPKQISSMCRRTAANGEVLFSLEIAKRLRREMQD